MIVSTSYKVSVMTASAVILLDESALLIYFSEIPLKYPFLRIFHYLCMHFTV